MQSKWLGSVWLIVAAAALVLLASADVEAQCSMCRAALNNVAHTKFVRNLNIGVLVLFIPPVTIFCSIFIILMRHRGRGSARMDAD